MAWWRRNPRQQWHNDKQVGGVSVQAGVIESLTIHQGQPATRDRPRMLPADVPAFTGRHEEVAQLLGFAAEAVSAAVVCAIDGTAGVGKTALALHTAHRVAEDFPDGQLHADLRGHTEDRVPLAAGSVLESFLRALGVPPDDIPAATDDRAALYRSTLAGRRMVVVLDNAASEAQVRPLLPGGAGCFVLVTSRRALSGLDTTGRMLLPVLPDDDATALLTTILGGQRIASAPEAAGDLVRLCAGLALALRIVAAKLSTDPGLELSALAWRLADENSRLGELAAGDRAVRAAFMLSYRDLPEAQARFFRRLALHPGVDFDAAAAAVLADVEWAQGGALLEQLVDARLVEHYYATYHRLHDLVRLFALELVAQDPAAERSASQVRIVDHYLTVVSTADAMMRGMAGDETSQSSALVYLDKERGNVVAAVRLAADIGYHEGAWRCAFTLSEYLERRRYLGDLLAVQQLALGSARAAGDLPAQGTALQLLTHTYEMLGRFDEATDAGTQGVEVSRRLGDLAGQGSTLSNIGLAHQESGRYDEAVRHYQRALELLGRADDTANIGHTLNNLGTTYRALGEHAKAVDHHRRAVEALREVGDSLGVARTLSNLGGDLVAGGEPEAAQGCLVEALLALRAAGDRHCEAATLFMLGESHRMLDRVPEALAHYRAAYAVFEDLGDQHRQGLTLLRIRALGGEV
ncbi:tetratricopeptide repeat protein [Solihabitans fulvus]|uniref:Tetratricopeptide repeat protein n=1 Tax=Solihabitans fulvus TaxID=1892852 RepID=A0A5B2WVZ0_9PSEU|nr:tetratricopeptide repeat protein [Solihabitans fulvus]KAA2255901.1 tetratricopeptide repeat protein [Solihabitans fulvus]